ncbi:MAG: HlyD family efflux transporter periplasmic adaptor subunit [Lachnospiraceae bacterium]|nr:HlyD family efflux transporter periplasmic adaptor subunit [Lachnospiraceae bacterium]
MKESFWKKHGKKIIILAVIAAAVTGIVLFVRKSVKASQELLAGMMNKSEVALVEKRTLVDSLAATGIVIPIESKTVTANVSNVKVAEFDLEVGDYVKEGDVICVLDSESFEDSMNATKKAYDAAKGQSNVNEVAAGRALDFAEESKGIDMGRAGEDASWAYQDYLRQMTEVEEAESEYKKAEDDLSVKKGELDYRNELLEEAKANEDFGKQAQYEQEIASWQSKVSGAETARDTAKSAYESAIKTADSLYRTYLRSLRSETDTERNDDNTVLAKNDSLYTSQITNNATGVNEKLQIKNYQKQIDECVVTAPISGVVTSVGVEQGKLYTGASIVTIDDDSAYEIEAQIDEYDITRIKTGQKVLFKTNGTGDREFEGKIKEIAPKATRSGQNGTLGSSITYRVTISIISPCKELKMDMTARLSIIIEQKENVLTVPYDALQVDENGDFFIEVPGEGEGVTEITYEEGKEEEKEKDNNSEDKDDQGGQQAAKPENKRIPVSKGLESDYYVQIIGPEIKEGMEVLVPSAGNGMEDLMQMLQDSGAMGGM